MKIILGIIDILATASILYAVLILLKKTRSIFILRGIFGLIILYVLALYLRLTLTILLFQSFVSFIVVILVVIFQKELRRFFENFSFAIFFSDSEIVSASKDVVETLGGVVNYLAKRKNGALVVLAGTQPIDRHLEGGYDLNGVLSKPLLLSIFDPSSPGHDGAVIIEGNLVKKFGAHLPLAENFKKYPELGTRHRAGLGLAERTDALVIIVSEERGTITIGKNGILTVMTNEEALKQKIYQFIGDEKKREEREEKNIIKKFFAHNGREKIFVLSLSTVLWYFLVHPLVK